MDWGVYILAGTALLFIGSLVYLVSAIAASRRDRAQGGQALLTLPAAVVTVEPFEEGEEPPAWVPAPPRRDDAEAPAPVAETATNTSSTAEEASPVPTTPTGEVAPDVHAATMEDILARPIRTGDWQPGPDDGVDAGPAPGVEPDLVEIAASLDAPEEAPGPYRARRRERALEHPEPQEEASPAPPEPHPAQRDASHSDLAELLAQLSALGLTVAPAHAQPGQAVMPPQTVVFPQMAPIAPQVQYVPQYAPQPVYYPPPPAPPITYVPPAAAPVPTSVPGSAPVPATAPYPTPSETTPPAAAPPSPRASQPVAPTVVTAQVAPPAPPRPIVERPAVPAEEPAPPVSTPVAAAPHAVQEIPEPPVPPEPSATVPEVADGETAQADRTPAPAESESRPPIVVASPREPVAEEPAPPPEQQPSRPHVTLRVASRPVEAAAAHAAQAVVSETGARATSEEAPLELELVSPVEMWFGEKRIGVKSGTKTFQEFQRLAGILFDDLKGAQATR